MSLSICFCHRQVVEGPFRLYQLLENLRTRLTSVLGLKSLALAVKFTAA